MKTPPLFLVASGNAGKLREIRGIFMAALPGVVCLSAGDHGVLVDYSEEGEEYLSNARSKARTVMSASGLPAIADDSGLEVVSLGGGPGVRSARYGENDAERIARLLGAMSGKEDRRCCFRAVAIVVFPDGSELTAEGIWEGLIAARPSGARGFGYDPIFMDPMLGRTAAELDENEKSRVSHRGKAMREIAGKVRAKFVV